MLDEELRNLAASISKRLATGDQRATLVPCDRTWLRRIEETLADMAEDVAHLQSQPVPQHMRRPALVGMYRPALSVVVGGKA